MKYTDLKKMPKDEFDKKLSELRTELMKLNAQVAIGTTPKSTKQIRDIKKNLARIETMRQESLKNEIDALSNQSKKSKGYIHS